jgi:hypothetical protein
MARHRTERGDLPVGALEERLRRLGEELPAAGPDPVFRDRLRGRLLAVAAVTPEAPSPAAPAGRRSRRVTLLPRLAIGASAGIVVVAGVGFASGHALPGEPLYGLKTGSEHLHLDLTHGDASRGRLQLAFARTRLHEVSALAQHHDLTTAAGVDAGATAGSGGRIAATLATMDAETEAGSADLVRAARGGDAGAGASLRSFAAAQRSLLTAVAPDLPQTAGTALATSSTVLTRVAVVAAGLPGAPPTGPTAPGSPSSPAPSGTPSIGAGGSGTPTGPSAPSTAPGSPVPGGTPTTTDAPTATPSTTPSATPSAAAPTTVSPSATPPAPPSSSPADPPSGTPTPASSTPAPTASGTSSTTPITPASTPPAAGVTVSVAPLPPIVVPLPVEDTSSRPGVSASIMQLVLTLLRALTD